VASKLASRADRLREIAAEAADSSEILMHESRLRPCWHNAGGQSRSGAW
jgi:hypothetical protein